MIENIFLTNEGSYDSDGAELGDLQDVNFIFGSNGAGKTTISRVIEEPRGRPTCKVSWKDGVALEARVYNRDFVRSHFDESSSIKGIYTFGENLEEVKEIETLAAKRSEFDADLAKLQKTLNGSVGNPGKIQARKDLEDGFRKDIWTEKQKLEDLKDAFEGCNSSRQKFLERYLEMVASNTAELIDLQELREVASPVFSGDLTEEPIMPKAREFGFSAAEVDPILSKRIVGKEDVDIAALILKLENSDWVQQGRGYLEKSEDLCPFCQQDLPVGLRTDLESYFDEAYLADIAAIDSLLAGYEANAKAAIGAFESIASREFRFLDRDGFEKDLKALRVLLDANIETIQRKKGNASTPFKLEASRDLLDALSDHINAANEKAHRNNETWKNQSALRSDLVAQIWKRFLEDTKTLFAKFDGERTAVDKAIEGLTKADQEKSEARDGIVVQIEEKEQEITSVKPTVDGINKMLASFGFNNFKLVESEKDGFYEVRRPNNQDAKETLSEGEKSFITFLYFYFWIKGSFGSSGATNDRVVVFDDPVSSLDSDVLFIVCNLIRSIMMEMRAGTSPVKQLFVLTHNIYFHREITFQKEKKLKGAGKLSHGFWVIRKISDKSEINKHDRNPVVSSYDLLWREVRQEKPSGVVIQNVLRRILEHYFTFYGGIDPDEIIERFEGKDKMICGALFSWVNDGSHHTHGDLYMSCTEEQVLKYLNVFQRIFEENEHGGHYKMMMKDAYVALPEEEGEGEPDAPEGEVTEAMPPQPFEASMGLSEQG